MKNKETVAVIINTLNRADSLENTLSSLQYLDHEHFEVVVVNGPSTDRTEQVLAAWNRSIKIGRCPEANLSMSRNIGIAIASADYVAFIDDDSIPEPEWLSQAVAAFDTDDIAAAGGRVFDSTGYNYQYQYANANRLGNCKWQLTNASPNQCFPMSFEFPYLQGTNMVYKRNLLLEIGGFDETFEYYLDETDVCLRLIDAGYMVRQLADAYVHHKHAPSHIRTKQVPKYRYPVLKSKIYFSNSHAIEFRTPEEIDADNQQFIEHHRHDIKLNIARDLLKKADLIDFEEHARRAWKLGKEAAISPRKIIGAELLAEHRSDFKPFPRLRPQGAQLTIVLLCEDYPPKLLGGIARFTQDKATALARLGHKVHVIAQSEIHNSVEFENGVWVHRIAPTNSPLSQQAEDLKVPQSHWNQSQSFLNELDRIASHREIHVVEAPVWNVVGIAPLLSGRYRLVTSLQTTLKMSLPTRADLTSNKNVFHSFVEPIVALERFVIEKSDMVLAISRAIASEVEVEYGLKLEPARLHVAHLGMPDWSRMPLATVQKHRNNTINILFVGRLEKRKGIDVLLEIIPRLCAVNSDLTFDIVGDDTIPTSDGKNYKDEFAKSYPDLVGTKVCFHGKIQDEQLRAFYAACDIFVAPSRFESFGLIYIEAMMFSKPVVACATGGVPEIVVDGKTGTLAKPGDADSLFQSIKYLIENKKVRMDNGLRGRQRYEELFTDQHMALTNLEMYYNCLKNNSIIRQDSLVIDRHG
jgi:glycosyltransferase involved in cell wall biosynthesis/GT2 family glycosyltransferase